MQENEPNIFFARTISDVLYQLKTIAGLQIIGGCTRIVSLPEKSLSIRSIEELQTIDKKERYIDFGPAVTFSQLLDIGKKRMPQMLYEAAVSIANPHVRNLATLGGNICGEDQRLTMYAPLLALDARLEIQSEEAATYVPLTNFTGIPHKALLVNIRIPIEEWDVSIFRRLGPSHFITETSASFAFLANTKKNILTNLRIAFAGIITFRSQELENNLIGTRLPLSAKNIDSLIQNASKQFDQVSRNIPYKPILKYQFLSLTRYSLEQLT